MPNDRHLPDWVEGFMKFTENSEPPETFRLWTAISVVAAALQRKCCLHWGSLDFYPNLYVVLVAPSGKARKGTAMTPGLKLLRSIGVKLAANATTREALIRDLKMSNLSEIDPSTGAVDIHASLTVFSKELTVFLGYQNRELMSNLTDWYDCDDDWEYRTKTQGVDDVKGVWLNLIGATTPDLIQASMSLDAIGGGLTSRMIFVYEQKKEKMVIMPSYSERDKEVEQMLQIDLDKIHMLSGDFRITTDFLSSFTDWRIGQENKPPFDDPRFAGYFERRPAHILKMSMVLSASRGDSFVIDSQDLERALSILERTEKKMVYTFSGVGKSALADTLARVMAEVAARGKTTFEELMAMFYYDADKWTMEKIVETMQAMRFIDISFEGTKQVIVYRKEEGEEDGQG